MIPVVSTEAATVWLVRHGQSVANAGGITRDFGEIPLTALGQQQAELFAQNFPTLSPEPPTLIVESPYLRARQTARPLIERFPEVPVETWPVQEFTYLDPLSANGLTEWQRQPLFARYWERDDPEYRDGDGTESFTQFLDRVRAMLRRLSELPPQSRVPVFTHGYAMQAVRLLLLFPGLTDRAMMSRSRNLNESIPIENTEILELKIVDGKLTALRQDHITPLTLEGVISHE
jgi:broad specificity phosphatase PhoE